MNAPDFDFNPFDDRPRLDSVVVNGVELKTGDQIRLRPRARADIFDIVLNGKTATIVAIEEDFENQVQLAVTIDDDPGKDFGERHLPAHRFFFKLAEVEPIEALDKSTPVTDVSPDDSSRSTP